jgi:protein dithiol oxidoreductase (disulfide-forming)
MSIRRWCTAIAFAAVLAACGKHGGSNEAAPRAPSSARPSSSAPTNQNPARAPEEKQNEITRTARVTEEGSETIEENTGDTGAHNPILAAVASSAAAATTPPTKNNWQEGVNYTRLVPAQPTSVGPDQVEVVEVFWYGCPHCYAIDPLLESWRKRKASYIKFVRVPVIWQDVHRAHARLFYTMDALGKLDQLHALTFKEIHVNGNMLAANDPAESERMQMEFLKRNGISEDDFKKTYRSFTVETDLQRAEELTLRYRIDGVPKFIVNGKFVTDVGMAKSPEQLVDLLDDLAAQEHKH